MGTVVLLSVRDDLPGRIVVRRDLDGNPRLYLALGGFLVAAASLTLGIWLVVMAVDLMFRRTPLTDSSALTAGLSVFVGLLGYGGGWVQSGAGDSGSWPMVAAAALGAATALSLRQWARPIPLVPSADVVEPCPRLP